MTVAEGLSEFSYKAFKMVPGTLIFKANNKDNDCL